MLYYNNSLALVGSVWAKFIIIKVKKQVDKINPIKSTMFDKKIIIWFLVFIFNIKLPGLAMAKISNDPQSEQWGYEDTGVYRAWDVTTGSRKVVVAVIDNGFDRFHPDLRRNVWKNVDEIPNNRKDDDKNGYIDDVWGWNFVPEDINNNGKIDHSEKKGNNNPTPDVINLSDADIERGVFHHGTVVAGIIGARGNNKQDGAGLNWRVRLMNIKILGNSGSGAVAPLAQAIRYAVNNGADVINVSMVGDESADLKTAINYAYRKGVVIVAAAGNNFSDLNLGPGYPICIDATSSKMLVLGVSAIGKDHRLARFSNVGSDCIDITAPGVGINSTARYSPPDGLLETYRRDWQGTSFAAPFVSGAAALIKSIQPTWRSKEIYQAILKSVHRTPPDDPEAYAELYGWGLLQVDKAVEYAAQL